MSTSVSRIAVTGLLFLFTLVSGVWLSSSGKPYNSGIFTIHKLIALGAVISTAVTIHRLRQSVDTRTIKLSAVVTTGSLFLFLFVSGALLSIVQPTNDAILAIHKIAPLLLLTLISGVWLTNAKKPTRVVTLTIHKLIALGTVIFATVTICPLRAGADIRMIELSAIIVTGSLFLSLFVSGALLSNGKPARVAILTAHKVAPLLAVISMAVTMYLLVSGKS
jgi:hypothetical protein